MSATDARHIVVVGLMGSGKTTIGAELASRLARPFRDSDAELQSTHGRTAREIAAAEGIDRLHELEANQLLDALAAREPSVVAAAASTIEHSQARTALAAPGVAVVWLRGSPEVFAARAASGGHRPEMGADPATFLAAQAARREPLFADIDPIVVDVDDAPLGELIRQVLGHLEASAT